MKKKKKKHFILKKNVTQIFINLYSYIPEFFTIKYKKKKKT